MHQDIIAQITAYGTIITAAATGALAALTYVLLLQNRALRKAGVEPRIVAYLEPHPEGHGGVNFVLANYGQGPAFNVRFSLVNDVEDFQNHDVLLQNDPGRGALTVVPQGNRITVLFGIGYVLFGSGEERGTILKPFDVVVDFNDIDGRNRSATYNIDVRQFSGLVGMTNKPPLTSISQSAEKIEKHLSRLVGNGGIISQILETTKLSDTHRQVAKITPKGRK